MQSADVISGSRVGDAEEAGAVVLDFTVEGPGMSRQTLTLPEGKRFYRFAH